MKEGPSNSHQVALWDAETPVELVLHECLTLTQARSSAPLWRLHGDERAQAPQVHRAPHRGPTALCTCTVEVILAVGEVLQKGDAFCLMVVAPGGLQQHDLERQAGARTC